MTTFNKRPIIILLTISALSILVMSVAELNSPARAESLRPAEITNIGEYRIPYFEREVIYSSENTQPQEIVGPIQAEVDIQVVDITQPVDNTQPESELIDEIAEIKKAIRESRKAASLSTPETVFLSFNSFVASVSNGLSTITGVYVPGVMALRVVPQPSGGSSVTEQYGAASLYGKAKGVGNIGLLAHNYLSGGNFYNLRVGSQVSIVYGTGKVVNYIVTRIDSFQATNPNNYTKPFINLANGNKVKTSKIFKSMYRSGEVTFQTCIARDGSNT